MNRPRPKSPKTFPAICPINWNPDLHPSLEPKSAAVRTPGRRFTRDDHDTFLARLGKMKEYRQWAISEQLPHLIVSRRDVEDWLKQTGHDPKLAKQVVAEADSPSTEWTPPSHGKELPV